jgi:hypothetical protein
MIQIQHPVANALAAQQLVRTIGIGEEVVLLRRFFPMIFGIRLKPPSTTLIIL